MNSSQFKKLIIALFIVGGGGAYFLWNDGKDWSRSESNLGGKVIPDFPLNDVTSIHFKDAEGEIALAKKEGVWTVGDRWNYPADFSKVGDLIQDVWDLKISRTISAGKSQYGRLGLVTPGEGANSGILLSFKGENDSEIANLLLGKEHMRKSESPSQFGGGGEFPDGRYVLPNGNSEAIALVSETFSSVDVDAKYWLNKDFIKVEKLQSAAVTHPEASDSWSVERDSETADMGLEGLADDEEIDSTKSYSLKNILSSPSFNDIVDPANDESSSGMETPITAELKTFDGFTYALKIGQADGEDNYPVQVTVSAELPAEREKPEDESEEDTERLDKEFADQQKTLAEKLEKEKVYESWTYLVSKWTVDALLNKRSDLIKQPEEEEGGDAAAAPAGPPLPIAPVIPQAQAPAPAEEAPSQAPAPEETPAGANAETNPQEVQAESAESGTDPETVDEVIDEVTNPLPAPEE